MSAPTYTDIAATCWRASGAAENNGCPEVANALERAGYIVARAGRTEAALEAAIAKFQDIRAESENGDSSMESLHRAIDAASEWLQLHGKEGE